MQAVTARAKVQYFIDGYRALQSPVRRLPPEILCQIFEYVSERMTNQPVNLLAAELWRISRVCARWHGVVMGTPTLWTNVVVDGSERFLEQLLPALRVSVKRAMPRSLTVQLQSLDSYSRRFHDALDLLAQSSKHWRRLSVDLTNAQRYPRIRTTLFGLKGKLDCLQELRLVNVQQGDLGDTFETARELRRATIIARGRQTVPDLPWSQVVSLTYLGTPSPHAADLHAVFRVMANLSHPDAAFTLRVVGDTGYLPRVTSHISSFSLYFASFTIWRTPHMEAWGRLWDSLTLPHLHTLTIGPYDLIDDDPPPWPEVQFRSLSRRSSFHRTLRVLRIANVVIDDTELRNVLEPLEALQWLEISDQGDHHTVLHGLLLFLGQQTPEGKPLRVPRLKYLSCDSQLVFTPQIYFNCILARVRPTPGKPVFEAVLRHLPSAPKEKRKEMEEGPLQNLVAQGRLRFSFEAWVHPTSKH
ncbi:hypothetical protein FB45DRAFT_1140804 [Roridomyces roridus]|uniref:F-box domain-containing protein n=1 Tax=Roridomyces roridus TaxID=1738132 RepID=A0AAD7F949_9AGAR|nr:hypothetical protein FB45DRAFT_1140804 [Roridomyces roridus]